MKMPIAQSQWCGYRVISLAANHIIDVWPTPDKPKGNEAEKIAECWKANSDSGYPGLLLLGCDIAADPDDLAAMAASVAQLPADLHTGMVKLWPASTSRDTWMWSHRTGSLGQPAVITDERAQPTYVSLGFLWVPARLLDLAAPVMGRWQHGDTDVQLSEVAIRAGIPAHAVPDCRPKHLHFQGEHDGEAIRKRAATQRSANVGRSDETNAR